MKWNGQYNWWLTIPGQYRENICGLCGHWDGDPKNDFTLRNGKVVGITFEEYVSIFVEFSIVWSLISP